MMVLAVPALLSACDDPGFASSDDRIEGRSEESIRDGLVQSVTVRSSSLLDRNDIEVRSVLLNTGNVAISLTTRICGLDFSGPLAVVEIPGLMRCMAYSGATTLAVGDSLVMSDLMRVASPPGTYTLRVRQALVPEHWARVLVTVRD